MRKEGERERETESFRKSEKQRDRDYKHALEHASPCTKDSHQYYYPFSKL